MQRWGQNQRETGKDSNSHRYRTARETEKRQRKTEIQEKTRLAEQTREAERFIKTETSSQNVTGRRGRLDSTDQSTAAACPELRSAIQRAYAPFSPQAPCHTQASNTELTPCSLLGCQRAKAWPLP